MLKKNRFKLVLKKDETKFGKDKTHEGNCFSSGISSRTGAFQSLLDGHSQVLQLPGIIYVNDDLIRILSIKSKKKLS